MSNPYAPPPPDGARPQGEAGGDGGDGGNRTDAHPAPTAVVGPTPSGAPPTTEPVRPTPPTAPPASPPATPTAPPTSPPATPTAPSAALTAPPAPDPDAVRRAGRLVTQFGLWMIASIVVGNLRLPWRMAGLVFVVAAIVVGVRAVRQAWRARLRGALVPLLVAGLSFAVLFGLSLASVAAVWSVQVEQQECRQSALTVSAQAACDRAYEQGLRDWRQRLQDRASGS
ncbi:hypothetical protein AGMMS50218_01670 [Actinomycetota bacterium]|nr:hypothetical protein AGMMS50218_01670 [Actinomycetota bacterium]